tara:strand:+ start:110 stop:307 length:198 start_codon:yes stop_codon:yes gene_type:complete
MSACNNLLWAGLGLAAGYALALYVEQLDAVIDDDDDGEGPNLRVVDDDEDPRHPFEYIDDEPGDG